MKSMFQLEFESTDTTSVMKINDRMKIIQEFKKSEKPDEYEYKARLQDEERSDIKCTIEKTGKLEEMEERMNFQKVHSSLTAFLDCINMFDLTFRYPEYMALYKYLNWSYTIAVDHENFPIQKMMIKNNQCIVFVEDSLMPLSKKIVLHYEIEKNKEYQCQDVVYFYGNTMDEAVNELLKNTNNDVLDAILSFL